MGLIYTLHIYVMAEYLGDPVGFPIVEEGIISKSFGYL